MADGAFDKLVVSLQSSEREAMLERLRRQSDAPDEPLYFKTEHDARKIDDEYKTLPVLLRIWYFIIGIIFGKPPGKVFEDSLVAKIGREINQNNPGLYNYSQGLLLPDFYKALVELKESARFFYNALDASVNKDRGAFYAFMLSSEAPETHYALSEISSPQKFMKTVSQMSEERLKQSALNACNEQINAIDAAHRDKMYQNVRSLICLKALSGFLFDRLLSTFQVEAALNGHVCPAGLAKRPLSSLNDILFSMKTSPPLALLGALFLFSLREKFENESGKVDAELQKLSVQTEKSVAIIRNFNKTVPLTLIMRCIGRDMSYEPEELPGGEDWFVIFRNYWRDLIEKNYNAYLLHKKREEIQKTFNIFFEDMELIKIEHIKSDDDPEGIPLKNEMMLSFLMTFYKKIFLGEMNQVLRPILIDGEFTRKENRTDFTESYNELIKMDDMMKVLIGKIGPGGDFGKRFKQLKTEVVSPTVRYRKMQVLREDIEAESDQIVQKVCAALQIMSAVIHGIIIEKKDGKYASLANYNTILGKANRDFKDGLKSASDKLMLAVDLTDNILKVENELG